MASLKVVSFRFYEELNDFLPGEKRKKPFSFCIKFNQTVKDAIEALGVPHTEVDLILANGNSVNFEYHLKEHDRISVYPVFESLDISAVTKLRPGPLRETKFVLDVHLGKLSKYLRMLGFDTYYRNDLDDDEIIKLSLQEKRIILTRDVGILKHGKVTHGYWLRSQDSKEQLREVIQRFDLRKQIRPFYRCTVCNGLVTKIDKQNIVHQIEENTKKYFNEFYQCSTCRQVYWEGSHYVMMRKFIDQMKKT
jgi:uncharacterized protein with PIN domain